uniref:Cyclin-like domain-containing protein n=2 Tax=Dunaliella tertiolecta TaxID=3047 RepID=A0A7S3QLZ1_DUNTE
MWCGTCAAEVEVDVDESHGFSCCLQCGRVVEDIAFASDVQFQRGPDGEGGMVGQMVGEGGQARGQARFSGGRFWPGQSDSHENALARGRSHIAGLVEQLHITPHNEVTESAHRLYRLAMQRGFTRGRRVEQVAATCLYIYCRQEARPYMLIDFSDHLSINVFTLGAVYLQLLRLFRLDEFPNFTKPIDPSLYLHRFVDRLKLGSKKVAVSSTALKLVQSMKRDWMQTGRRPSGICGAALFIASHIHGIEKTKREIISVVHVGWNTVEKRVMEFANSNMGEMTVAGFEAFAQGLEEEKAATLAQYEKQHQEQMLALPAPDEGAAGGKGPAAGGAHKQADQSATDAENQDADEEADPSKDPEAEEAGQLALIDPEAAAAQAREKKRVALQATGACEHVALGTPIFAHGMCRNCFEEYLTVSGGICPGAVDPPAYTRNVSRDFQASVLAALPSEREGVAPAGLLTRAPDQIVDPDFDPELVEMNEALHREELLRLTHAMGGAARRELQESNQGASTSSGQDHQQHPQQTQQQEQAPSQAGPQGGPKRVRFEECSAADRLTQGEEGAVATAPQQQAAKEGRDAGVVPGAARKGVDGGEPETPQVLAGPQGMPETQAAETQPYDAPGSSQQVGEAHVGYNPGAYNAGG